SGDADAPSWRREWVPFVAERDGFSGRFVNARTGTVGSWCEGRSPADDEYLSLSAFFQEVAERLGGAAPDDGGGRGVRAGGQGAENDPGNDPVRRWARGNGFVVNDHGRIPAAIREAYERWRAQEGGR
ncbi:hypothetical protein GTW43_19990, partial [Streptomyces sp. SID5785]|uniref:Lsr2 family DNA-binding protein n=1 Tax=Streptomyces sp. SID5785 TaxID=2690309 RepID=UPI001360DC4B